MAEWVGVGQADLQLCWQESRVESFIKVKIPGLEP